MARVVLKGVYKEYPGNVKAVVDANLEVADREFVVLVGPSGCGKSTTLRMIAGLEEVTAGTITIGERAVNDIPPKDRDIAMVFQNYALYPHMTVFENMAFGLKLRRFPKAEIRQRVDEAARILGIAALLDRKPKVLSGGERQRVALGRAIVRKPAAFLFDEPLSNLDAKLRVDMRVELNRLHKKLATTMIYVTHDQIEAMTLADRIVIMDKGRIQQTAGPLVLYNQPANKYVAGFIGSPPMNFFPGVLESVGGSLSFTDGVLRIPLLPELAVRLTGWASKAVELGIRPEMISGLESARTWPAYIPVTARVDVVEALGDQKVVYLSTEKTTFVAKFEASIAAEAGRQMQVAFNMARIHIFDAQTGVNLTA